MSMIEELLLKEKILKFRLNPNQLKRKARLKLLLRVMMTWLDGMIELMGIFIYVYF